MKLDIVPNPTDKYHNISTFDLGLRSIPLYGHVHCKKKELKVQTESHSFVPHIQTTLKDSK